MKLQRNCPLNALLQHVLYLIQSVATLLKITNDAPQIIVCLQAKQAGPLHHQSARVFYSNAAQVIKEWSQA
jgi:hypothetical protein